MEKIRKMEFRQVGGTWLRVDSREPKPPTLAEILETLNIVIDDDTQFCRIIRYYNNIKRTITYRANGGTITINIHEQ